MDGTRLRHRGLAAALGAALVLVGCATSTSPGPAVTAGVPHTATPPPAVLLDDAACPADAVIASNPQGALIPSDFVVKGWVRCASDDGTGSPRRQSHDGPADDLLRALALPNLAPREDQSCPARAFVLPYLLAVSADGKAVHVWIPVDETCGDVRAEVATAIEATPWS